MTATIKTQEISDSGALATFLTDHICTTCGYAYAVTDNHLPTRVYYLDECPVDVTLRTETGNTWMTDFVAHISALVAAETSWPTVMPANYISQYVLNLTIDATDTWVISNKMPVDYQYFFATTAPFWELMIAKLIADSLMIDGTP
jgi:hypothetical protein